MSTPTLDRAVAAAVTAIQEQRHGHFYAISGKGELGRVYVNGDLDLVPVVRAVIAAMRDLDDTVVQKVEKCKLSTHREIMDAVIA